MPVKICPSHSGMQEATGKMKKYFPYKKSCVILAPGRKELRQNMKYAAPDSATLNMKGESIMKHIKTLNTRKLQNTVKKGGCGECQTSCQSACKTSCTVGNQTCEHSR